MKRVLVFLLLLVAFVVWTFPHRRVVEHVLGRRLEPLRLELALGDVQPKLWPPGYSLTDVRVSGHGLTVTLDSVQLRLLFASGFRARACAGSLDGNLISGRAGAPDELELRFTDVNPSVCVQGTPVTLSGSFTGTVSLSAGNSAALAQGPERGSITLAGTNGTVSGYLPGATDAESGGEPGKPIGSWDFQRVELRARIEHGELLVEDASADAESVRWELSGGRLATAIGGRTRLSAELRARRMEDTPRAKAVLGVLPRAGEGADGWRRYRISGTLDSPKIIGLK